MESVDLQDFIDRYETRLAKHGHSPLTLGWGKTGRQEIRFNVLAREALADPECSILDVGCGFADLYDFLTARGWNGEYTGVDIVPGLLNVARQRHPHLNLLEADITAGAFSLPSHDYTIASGVFNARLKGEDNLDHCEKAIRRLFKKTKKILCVDFMSTYVDYQHPDGWHADPAWAFSLGKSLSRRVAIRHDYMPFEFAIFIYKDDSVSERNVFNSTEKAALATGSARNS